MPIPAWLAQTGQQAAGAAANSILGIAFGGINDARQVRQQRRLNKVNMAYNQEMTEYNMKKQLELWEKTGYGAQKEQMKEAGLNPALMYGTSGGGGQSTSVATSNQGSAGAPSGGGEIMGAVGMGLNMQLMKAQKDLLESQTAKNNAEAKKTAGTDTEESQARIGDLLQGIDNKRQQYEIQRLEITLKNIENFEKQTTQENRLDYIMYQTEMAERQLQLVRNEAYVSSAVMQDKINIVKTEAIGAVLKNALTEAQTGATKTGAALDQQKINESAQQIMQEWDKLDQNNREILIKKRLADYNTDPTTDFMKGIMGSIDDIFRILKRK